MNKCIASDVQEMLPDLLHDAFDDRAKARVEAHFHHAAQAVAMPGEQGVQGLAISSTRTFDQVHGLGRVIVHQGPHTLLPARRRHSCRVSPSFLYPPNPIMQSIFLALPVSLDCNHCPRLEGTSAGAPG